MIRVETVKPFDKEALQHLLDATHDGAIEGLKDGAHNIAQQVQAVVLHKASLSKGNIYKSIKIVQADDNTILIDVQAKHSGTINWGLPGGHSVTVDPPLIEWFKKVLGKDISKKKTVRLKPMHGEGAGMHYMEEAIAREWSTLPEVIIAQIVRYTY